MFMVMDSHLKKTKKLKKALKIKDRQALYATLIWSFKTERTQPHLHAQLWGVRKEIHQHMNIQFRRSFYLQTLLLCTSVADNVLDQSFKKTWAQISLKPVEKNLTHNKKLQRECTVSTENYYKHNTEYNRLKQMDIWTFTVANSD